MRLECLFGFHTWKLLTKSDAAEYGRLEETVHICNICQRFVRVEVRSVYGHNEVQEGEILFWCRSKNKNYSKMVVQLKGFPSTFPAEYTVLNEACEKCGLR